MPTLLETQHAMRTWLVDGERAAAAALLADGIPPDRLDIYRNTFVANATRALRLTYPAVHQLVGDEFFEGAAAAFVARHPPRSACFDHYGEPFAAFLAAFPPAASLGYLADVARLEWAVSRAIHADDVEPLDLARLVALSPGEQERVAFVPHPSVSLLSLATSGGCDLARRPCRRRCSACGGRSCGRVRSACWWSAARAGPRWRGSMRWPGILRRSCAAAFRSGSCSRSFPTHRPRRPLPRISPPGGSSTSASRRRS